MGIDRPSGRRYFHIARALVQRGHRVRLLALHPDLERCLQRRFVQDGVDIWYVGQMHARKRNGSSMRFAPHRLPVILVQATCGIIWGIICSPADVYHLGKPQPVNGVAALLGVVLWRRQSFYIDCDDDEVTSNQFTAEWQRALFAFWQWLLPHLAQGATVNTHFLAARMPHRLRVVLVPNGVDLVSFRRPPQPVLDGLQTALGLTGRRVIAYSGTLALHNHPVDLLLEALVLVREVLPDTVLLLIGSGSDAPLLARCIVDSGLHGHVCCIGHVPHHSLPAYLALADMSIDPVYDNDVARARSPLKLFESLALGVPVVTGDVGDRAEMLAEGQAGVLVAPGDARALAAGIISLLRDEATRRQMAAFGVRHVQHYSWHALATRWETVYDADLNH
jgi:glycosyltransferase involved in cell wall biosynthesis